MIDPTPTPVAPSVDERVRAAIGLITEEEMAKTLQLQSIDTLATWRSQRRGPPFVKLGKKVFYTLADFTGWVSEESRRQREDAIVPPPPGPPPVFDPVFETYTEAPTLPPSPARHTRDFVDVMIREG